MLAVYFVWSLEIGIQDLQYFMYVNLCVLFVALSMDPKKYYAITKF